MAFEVPSLPAATPINPWLSIWIRPRATMRYVLNTDPKAFVFGLCYIGALGEALSRSMGNGLGDRIPFPFILLLCVVGSLFTTMLSLAIGARLLRWAGGLLGGQGTLEGVRAALGWSQVPALIMLLLWLPLLALVGPELFTSATPRLDSNPILALLLALTGLLQGILGIWAFVLYIKCLGEAHQFSSWRALGASILAVLPFVMVAVCLIVGIGVLTLLGGRVAP